MNLNKEDFNEFLDKILDNKDNIERWEICVSHPGFPTMIINNSIIEGDKYKLIDGISNGTHPILCNIHEIYFHEKFHLIPYPNNY